MSKKNYNLIFNASEHCEDHLNHQIEMWKTLSYNITGIKLLRLYSRLVRIPLLGHVFNLLLHNDIEFNYEIIAVFKKAC